MSRTPTPLRAAAMLVAAAILLTACGGDDTTADPATSGPASNAATEAPPTSAGPATAVMPTTTAAGTAPGAGGAGAGSAADEPTVAPVHLLADGLGVVAFGTPYDEALTALTAALGQPDHIGSDVFEPALGTRRTVSWGHLGVDFAGDADPLRFSAYRLARTPGFDDDGRFVLPDWDPEPWEVQVATAGGLRIDDTTADAAAAYPDVYAPRCDGGVDPSDLEPDDDIDQLFVAPAQSGLYLYRPIDGIVWAIGAQAERNPLICDGYAG